MSDYTPDRWVVLEMSSDKQEPVLKVFAGWYGGFAGSDSWKLNSGITAVKETNDYFFFDGSSGSCYSCRKGSYGTNMYGQGVLNNLIDKIERAGGTCIILPEETNWTEIHYE